MKVGQDAPDFAARNLEGDLVSLRKLIDGRKALLIFYRGGWCPYCNKQLADISQDSSKFAGLGTTIVAVSGEEVQKGKDLLRKLALPFTLLSDAGFEGIGRYGVRDPKPSERLKSIGVNQLARPAAFIIDRKGKVRYMYVGKDATDRPKNEDLLRVLNEI